MNTIKSFLLKLRFEFEKGSLEANYFLGLEIQRLPDGLKIFQNSYSKKMLEKFGFTDCTPVSTPIEERSATTDVNDMIEKNMFTIIKW